jgi:hypothetical protein
MMCKELGPMITPARIKPMMPGIRKRLKSSGEKRIIKRVSARISTGFLTGRY